MPKENHRLVVLTAAEAVVYHDRKRVATFQVTGQVTADEIEAIRTAEHKETVGDQD